MVLKPSFDTRESPIDVEGRRAAILNRDRWVDRFGGRVRGFLIHALARSTASWDLVLTRGFSNRHPFSICNRGLGKSGSYGWLSEAENVSTCSEHPGWRGLLLVANDQRMAALELAPHDSTGLCFGVVNLAVSWPIKTAGPARTLGIRRPPRSPKEERL